MIVLTKNQLLMGYRLVLASGRDGEPKKLIGEILGMLGGGLVFRQLARQLVGLIPVVGIIPKVAVAYGGTWAIGRAVVLWVTEGRTASAETLRTLSREGLLRGRDGGQGPQRARPRRRRQGERALGSAAVARPRVAPPGADPGAGRRRAAAPASATPAAVALIARLPRCPPA